MPTLASTPRRSLRCLAFAALALLAGRVPAWAQEPEAAQGEPIYRQSCAQCHGAKGEGTPEEYSKPLVGDKSVGELTRLIQKTMPADDPGSLSDEQAQAVAAYIHGEFYSPLAQARNRPARIELSRLTVAQYRNAVADLIGSFRQGSAPWDERRGLAAEYYKGRRFRRGQRAIERIDPKVQFDFGEGSPDPSIPPEEFSIRWEGSLLAPDTGLYEFTIRTEHAARFWLNDMDQALIDAWVKSGNDTEYKATIHLLGGRVYPLRLEYSKGKQGVDDSKKQKEKPKPVKSSIALEWTRPGYVAEAVPERYLAPVTATKVDVIASPFPPDDRSIGYERGTSISKEWTQATTDAAIEAAGLIFADLRTLAGVSPVEAADRADRLRDFARRFAERAFRRPLSPEQQALYVDRVFSEVEDPDTALRRVILLVLKSPRFLYRELGDGTPDGYTVASRLSFGLWDSLPDSALLEAAAKGQLATREQVAAQAERMVGDLRFRSKLRAFLLQWLKVDQVPDLTKDAELFPGFDPAVASDLRSSLELALDEIIASPEADFRRLFLEDGLYLNGRLAALYDADLPSEAPFQKVTPRVGERAGVLSHPYLMAHQAYTASSSPIHRGVFVARSVLGRVLRPPPIAVAPLAPDLHPDLTTRERVVLQTSPEACQSCHNMINPLGFALENFDAVGRFRTEEKGKPVEATGQYLTRDGVEVSFSGVRDLASFIVGSEEAHESFVEHLFHALVKQPVRAYGSDQLDKLRQGFVDGGFNIRTLAVAILADTALTPVAPPDGGDLSNSRGAEKNDGQVQGTD